MQTRARRRGRVSRPRRTLPRLVRIVAGERKGTRLVAPAGRATRPTSDRAREALFAILADVSGADVLDAFAGSGALGLEALSRGAERAVFCETSVPALRALRENVRRLRYEERTLVRREDARRRLAADHAGGTTYDLLFLDPPYRLIPVLHEPFSLHVPGLLAPGGVAVIESSADAAPPELPLELRTSRIYGDARLSVYARG
jgi:16S rRNA (guanine966-N2)-methyltransferase